MIAPRASVALALAAVAIGCGGDSQCGGGARSSLSIWGEQQHRIGATFKLMGARPASHWRLVFVHEGHVWRGRAQADGDGALTLRRHIDDYRGVDQVSVRAYGPDGATCAAATDLSDGQT
jgi:hypothetical protein